MNVHESEKLAGFLEERGYVATENQKEADIIVFNTCCIRKAAEDKILANIGYVKNIKAKNPNLIVAVCGCMSQQEEKANYIYKTFPFVNLIFGTHNISSFGDYLDEFARTEKRILSLKNSTEQLNEEVPMYRTSGYNAWVNIMYGCNNFCTYCIVPYVRGREISRKMDDIIKEVENLLKTNQYKVVTLLGQNVNSYGKDLDDGSSFAKLMQKICELPYEFKLKFMTSHPKDLTDDVIDTIANNDKIAKYIHLPVQSGSNRILKLMNRNYTAEHYLATIEKIRSKIPNIALTSDFIVGFPTETDEDFEMTCDLVRKVRYNGLFAFMYSPREGTPASKMDGQILQSVKNQRVNALINLERQISKELAKELIGRVENCIVDSEIEYKNNIKRFMVKSDCGKSIIVESNKLNLLDIVNVEIIKIEDNQFYGKLV